MASRRDAIPAWETGCAAHDWGSIAADVDDPPHCVSECRERFLRAMLPKDETFGRLCEVFEDRDHMDKEKPFHSLYCCDSQLCGVDNLGEIGKDPNVNWFINVCQDIGYHSITDPGPPDSTYTCSHDAVYGGGSLCQSESPEVAIDNASSSPVSSESITQTPTVSIGNASSNGNTAVGTPTPTSNAVPSSMPDQTYSRITDPSLSTSVDPSNTEGEVQGERGLSTSVKITIGLTTVIAIAVIVALVICLLRRRSRKGDIHRKIKHPSSPAPAGSPTPLVSPVISNSEVDGIQLATSHTDVNGVQLTPPARLRERRLLPTAMHQRLPLRGEPVGQPGFPMSPLYSPTAGKLTPRHERTPKIRHGDNMVTVPRIVMTASHGGYMGQDDCPSPLGSQSSTSSAFHSRSTVGYRNSSPTRLPRSHFNISELVSPGPPPNRALPFTPPNGSSSLTSTTSRPNDANITSGLSHQHPAQVQGLSPDSRELCDLTEEYSRESHNSWGSWGGGCSSASISPLRKGKITRSPVMGEAELERLGGKY
ncbi:hypothetical protein B0J13DRAFT_641829 [Dactylonectria estremocensis]|uniref:Extracellular membrane protein CFEM domain-containing protein n=1 Tax=Dactylonectria estremocensis TaxID=1079267 RepID=A0A9P9E9S6_9HYPO|nr:hypothetical protein B0J13DRAFT_641829 [Dactylonectria estremocensis]